MARFKELINGSLAEVLTADAIRAIKDLNDMEREERERGGGKGTDFETLLMLIAKRPRLLPHEDPDDMIDID